MTAHTEKLAEEERLTIERDKHKMEPEIKPFMKNKNNVRNSTICSYKNNMLQLYVRRKSKKQQRAPDLILEARAERMCPMQKLIKLKCVIKIVNRHPIQHMKVW